MPLPKTVVLKWGVSGKSTAFRARKRTWGWASRPRSCSIVPSHSVGNNGEIHLRIKTEIFHRTPERSGTLISLEFSPGTWVMVNYNRLILWTRSLSSYSLRPFSPSTLTELDSLKSVLKIQEWQGTLDQGTRICSSDSPTMMTVTKVDNSQSWSTTKSWHCTLGIRFNLNENSWPIDKDMKISLVTVHYSSMDRSRDYRVINHKSLSSLQPIMHIDFSLELGRGD